MNLWFYLINMANIAASNYKDRKILKQHKNFMLDRPSVRRPNNTRRIEFHAGQCPMSDTYFKPWSQAWNLRRMSYTSKFNWTVCWVMPIKSLKLAKLRQRNFQNTINFQIIWHSKFRCTFFYKHDVFWVSLDMLLISAISALC